MKKNSSSSHTSEKEYVIADHFVHVLNNTVKVFPGNVYWKDKNGVYLGYNDSMLKIANVTELKGKTDFDLPWKEDAARIQKTDQEVIRAKKSLELEEVITLADGQRAVMLAKKTPLADQDGNIIGILVVSLNITEQKTMETALREAKLAEAASRAKSEFIANMSHDIRTPLAGIISIAQILAGKEQSAENKQCTSWLLESSEQLLNLLNEVLGLISSGNLTEQDICEECFNLRQNIEAIGKLEMPAIKAQGLDLQIHIDKAAPDYIVTDRIKLQRILLNLLSNAIKFTKEGHVSLEVNHLAEKGNEVQLEFSVVDTGIGIPSEAHAKVFDRFYRVNPTTCKNQYQGHGVGLHIAQKYIGILGSEIKLTSEIGKGTTFSFILTLKIGNEKDAVAVPVGEKAAEDLTFSSIQNPPVSSQSPKILLVEDNAVALKAAEIAVTKAGCRFHSVINAEQALELVKTNDFALLITDIGLPGLSGIELAQCIREWEHATQRQPLPIVGLTAHAKGSKIEQDCLQGGVNKVIAKPVDLADVKAVLKQFIVADANFAKKEAVNSQLGVDLPDSEEQLFALEQYPLLDVAEAIKILGNEEMAKEMLQQMIDTSLSDDKEKIKEAFAAENWEAVEKLAHKIKGGAVYCGTIRLRYACQYLERYRKAGYLSSLEPLYHQLITVLNATKYAINDWLGIERST